MMESSALKATAQLGVFLLGTWCWWKFQFLTSSASHRVVRIEPWSLTYDEFFLRAVLVIVGGLAGGLFIEKLVLRMPSVAKHSTMLGIAGMDLGVLGLLFLGQKLLLGGAGKKHGAVRRRELPLKDVSNLSAKIKVAQIPLAGIITYLAAIPAVMLAYQASLLCIHYLGFEAPPQSLLKDIKGDESFLTITVSVAVAVILAPITEEVIYRAGVFRAARQTFGPWAAYSISSVLFAFSHWNLNSFCPLLVLGFVLAMGYERMGRIGVPIIAHALFNLTSLFSVCAT